MGEIKKYSEKAEYWNNHIKRWEKSDITQSHYCIENKLNQSSFSKWKAKLSSKTRSRHRTYNTKNKYCKFTKLSNEQIECLMRLFLLGATAKYTSKTSGVSSKTVSKFYMHFREAVFNGALNYHQLFFRSGSLLMLGVPPHINLIIKSINKQFPGVKISRKKRDAINKRSEDSLLDTYLKLLYHVLLYNSQIKWTASEMYLFNDMAYKKCFLAYLSKRGKGLANSFDEEFKEYARKHTFVDITRINWNLDFSSNKEKSALNFDVWLSLYYERQTYRITNDSYWHKAMYRDLKWFLRKHPIGSNSKPLSNYWPIDKINHESVEDAKKKIIASYNSYTERFS